MPHAESATALAMASAEAWTAFSPSTGSMQDRDEWAALQAENTRLITLLEFHGIEWRPPPRPLPPAAEPARLSVEEKAALVRHLFRGRTDVYPIRWESRTTSKSGYTPACVNEWRIKTTQAATRGPARGAWLGDQDFAPKT